MIGSKRSVLVPPKNNIIFSIDDKPNSKGGLNSARSDYCQDSIPQPSEDTSACIVDQNAVAEVRGSHISEKSIDNFIKNAMLIHSTDCLGSVTNSIEVASGSSLHLYLCTNSLTILVISQHS